MNPLLEFGTQGARPPGSPDINPLRVQIVTPLLLPTLDLQRTMVCVLDTRLAPVVAAALGGGSPAAQVFRNGAEIALALSEDERLGTDDLIGISAGSHTEFVMGGVFGEPRDPASHLGAERAAAERRLEASRLALLNAKHNNSGDQRQVDAADASLRSHERRLAKINAQLGGGAAGGTSSREFDPTGADRNQVIAAMRRRREVEAAMERFWRDHSFRAYERDVDGKPLVFASGDALHETIAAACGGDQGQAAGARVVLGSATNLGAVRRSALRWWEDAAVPLTHFEPNPTGRGMSSPNDRLILVVQPPEGSDVTSASDHTEGAAVGRGHSVGELLGAIVTYALLQLGEVEMDEADEHTRELLQVAVRAAAGGAAGWADVQARLEAALRREAAGHAVGGELHEEELRVLLDFDRHSAVPELQPRAAGGSPHVFTKASA